MLVATAVRCKTAVCSFLARMSSTLTYEEAVQKLNSLQSNKATIEQIRKDIRMGQKCTNLEDMESYLLRTGVTLSTLDDLSVIHVAGTKGKGSTSAMCESILRHHGYKTGFYSSPHLVSVSERIRLNGQIISKEKFAKYFHEVYSLLKTTGAYDGDMPKYFAFLTVLAFNVFIKEKVDVAIVEVGIGGVVDYTNVLRKVHVVGITALGLDHTSILGNTIEEIAEAKAGIMKSGCEAFTVQQPPEAMAVLKTVAKEVQCTLHTVPDYEKYEIPKECDRQLQVDLPAYYLNASLAIQLAHSWINRHKRITNRNSLRTPFMNGNTTQHNGYNGISYESIVMSIPNQTVIGLKKCQWPGRYQIIKSNYAQFYLDGAHTKESMEICSSWFLRQTSNRKAEKVLIFSATGDRDGEILMKPLQFIDFQRVYFVNPMAYKELNTNNDNYSAVENKELLARCFKHVEIWNSYHSERLNAEALGCVSDALIEIKKIKGNPSVLITGSLHLVGAALSILDSSLSGNQNKIQSWLSK